LASSVATRARARSLAKTIIHNAATSAAAAAAAAAAALPESIRHEPQFSNWLPSLPVASHTSAPFCAATAEKKHIYTASQRNTTLNSCP